MGGCGENLFGLSAFDDPAEIHDQYPVAQTGRITLRSWLTNR